MASISSQSPKLPEWQIASKLPNLYLRPSICANFCPFCNFVRSYDQHMPYKVHFRCFFVDCKTIFNQYLDLDCSKWKIGVKIYDFVIWTFNLHKLCSFRQISILLRYIYAFQSTFLLLFCFHNDSFSPDTDLQYFIRELNLKIFNFVALAFILHNLWPFLHV